MSPTSILTQVLSVLLLLFCVQGLKVHPSKPTHTTHTSQSVSQRPLGSNRSYQDRQTRADLGSTPPLLHHNQNGQDSNKNKPNPVKTEPTNKNKQNKAKTGPSNKNRETRVDNFERQLGPVVSLESPDTQILDYKNTKNSRRKYLNLDPNHIRSGEIIGPNLKPDDQVNLVVYIEEEKQDQQTNQKLEIGPNPSVREFRAYENLLQLTDDAQVRDPVHRTDDAVVRDLGHPTDAAVVRNPGHRTDDAVVRDLGHPTDAAVVRNPGHRTDDAVVRDPGHRTDDAVVRDPGHRTDNGNAPQSHRSTRKIHSSNQEKERQHGANPKGLSRSKEKHGVETIESSVSSNNNRTINDNKVFYYRPTKVTEKNKAYATSEKSGLNDAAKMKILSEKYVSEIKDSKDIFEEIEKEIYETTEMNDFSSAGNDATEMSEDTDVTEISDISVGVEQRERDETTEQSEMNELSGRTDITEITDSSQRTEMTVSTERMVDTSERGTEMTVSTEPMDGTSERAGTTSTLCSLLDDECLAESVDDNGGELERETRNHPFEEKVCMKDEDECSVEDKDKDELDVQTAMEEVRRLYQQKVNMEHEIDELLASLEGRMTNGTQRKVYEDLVNQIADNVTGIANVHVMEIPLYEILQQNFVTVLQEREQFFRDMLKSVEENVGLMTEWLQIAKQTLLYKEDQGVILFGEFSSVNNILHTGMSTIVALTEQFFVAVESITTIKTQFLNSFLAGAGSEDFFQKAQNFTVGELIPAKINFLLNAYNNSEAIAKIFGEMVKNANTLLETKYQVVESIVHYSHNKMKTVRQTLGTNLTFIELLNSVQRGTILKEINVGPIRVKGDVIGSYETERIIGNLVRMGEPKLPIIGIPVKQMFANTEHMPVEFNPHERKKYINGWLTKQLSSAVKDTLYTLFVKHGEAVLETTSPPVDLGNKCGLGFRIQGGKGRASIGRTSQVSLTAGPAFGFGRPPSLDIVTSAWLDTYVSYSSKVHVSASKGVFGHCISKLAKLVNVYVAGNAKSYLSVKFSIIKIKLEPRKVHTAHMYGVEVPHIVIKFRIHLAGELYSMNLDALRISNCNLKVMGLTLFSYCGLLERLLHDEAREAAKSSLPFSSPRVLRQVERTIMKRAGNEISIPLFVLEDNPVERFLSTANNIIQLGESLVKNVTNFQGQMTDIMKIYRL